MFEAELSCHNQTTCINFKNVNAGWLSSHHSCALAVFSCASVASKKRMGFVAAQCEFSINMLGEIPQSPIQDSKP